MKQSADCAGRVWDRAICNVFVTYSGVEAAGMCREAMGRAHLLSLGGIRRDCGAIRQQQGGKQRTQAIKLCMPSQ